MRPNPGGQIGCAFGREDFIREIWNVLKGDISKPRGSSIYINDLRRMGKTVILHELARNCDPKYIVINWDVEEISNSSDFIKKACKDCLPHLKLTGKLSQYIQKGLEKWSGASVAGVITLPEWGSQSIGEVFRDVMSDLNEALEEKDKKIVFLWDEFPALLENIIKNHKEGILDGYREAGLLLDTLRSIRQNFPNIQMILTGSIGIHHILRKLRENGYSNSPLNDMEQMSPGPLAPDKGAALALELLRGDNLPDESLDECATVLSTKVAHIPFYIHKLVGKMRSANSISIESIDELWRDMLINGNQEMEHYYTRISNQYEKGSVRVIEAVLDMLACTHSGMSEQEIRIRLGESVDERELRNLLSLLIKDHYLARETKRSAYVFRYDFIKHWWCLDRGLS